MHVTFKAPQKFGYKDFFKAGKQEVPNHLAGNSKFKELVKSGHIIVHAKSDAAQAIQAGKDARNVLKAEIARKLSAEQAAPLVASEAVQPEAAVIVHQDDEAQPAEAEVPKKKKK